MDERDFYYCILGLYEDFKCFVSLPVMVLILLRSCMSPYNLIVKILPDYGTAIWTL
jgi:hypothetical protein